jgi:HEAT repeat protein
MLVWLGPGSVELLIDALSEPRTQVQAALALAYVADPRAAEPLRPLMIESPDPDVRRAAAWALGAMRDQQAGAALLGALDRAGRDSADLDEASALAPESLRSRDMDALAELYTIAVDASRGAARAGDAEQEEHWQDAAAAIVDEARRRPASERGEGSSSPAGLVSRRRRRERARLLEACAQRSAEIDS